MFARWTRNFTKVTQKQLHRGIRRPRLFGRKLFLEVLEDRTVLSVFTPTTFSDSNVSGAGSLRDAIIAANADTGKATDTILLNAGTYTLSVPNSATGGQENAAQTGDLDITNTRHELIIEGAVSSSGAIATIIDQTVADRVFQVFGARVDFENVIIEGGQAVDDGTAGFLPGSTNALGGGILNQGGTVSLSNVIVQNNQAQGSNGHAALGGGIYSSGGSLIISGSTITNNQAVGSTGATGAVGATGTAAQPNGGNGGNGSSGGNAAGGGLFVSNSVVNLTVATVSFNKALGGAGGSGGSGGAGYTFDDGSAGGRGGKGGYADNGGTAQGGGFYASADGLTLTNVTFASNDAIGGAGGVGGGGGSGGSSFGVTGSSGENGGNGGPGGQGATGGVGGNGSMTQGGAFYTDNDNMSFNHVRLSGNSAQGGDGGDGGSGGAGGASLGGDGGAISGTGSHAGNGGNAGAGGAGGNAGAAGSGGTAQGGGLYALSDVGKSMNDILITDNTAAGGQGGTNNAFSGGGIGGSSFGGYGGGSSGTDSHGGNGGEAGSGGAGGSGGSGGLGGDAQGGGMYSQQSRLALTASTLSDDTAAGGTGGYGGFACIGGSSIGGGCVISSGIDSHGGTGGSGGPGAAGGRSGNGATEAAPKEALCIPSGIRSHSAK